MGFCKEGNGLILCSAQRLEDCELHRWEDTWWESTKCRLYYQISEIYTGIEFVHGNWKPVYNGERKDKREQWEVNRAASGNPLTWKIPNFTNAFTVMMDREGALVGSKHGLRNSCVSDIVSGDSLPNLFTITGSMGTAKKWMDVLRLVWENTWKHRGRLLLHLSFLLHFWVLKSSKISSKDLQIVTFLSPFNKTTVPCFFHFPRNNIGVQPIWMHE